MSTLKRTYLIAYNAISAVLWAVVFGRTAGVLLMRGTEGFSLVYPVVGDWTKWTQTLAGLEMVHALLGQPATTQKNKQKKQCPRLPITHKLTAASTPTGIVPAGLLTTAMQVSSRFALVWGAVHFYPPIAASPAYSSMLLAWSFTEVVRYMFFALTLSGVENGLLQWLRYSGFFVLYPVGISSELYEMYLAFLQANKAGNVAHCVVIAVVMATYIPGKGLLFWGCVSQLTDWTCRITKTLRTHDETTEQGLGWATAC